MVVVYIIFYIWIAIDLVLAKLLVGCRTYNETELGEEAIKKNEKYVAS